MIETHVVVVTPAATLSAAIACSIKDLAKASPFKKVGRALFEA